LTYDPNAFTGMNPCGFSSETMISLEQLMNAPVDSALFKQRLKNQLLLAL
jgi:lipoate-protein ligase B